MGAGGVVLEIPSWCGCCMVCAAAVLLWSTAPSRQVLAVSSLNFSRCCVAKSLSKVTPTACHSIGTQGAGLLLRAKTLETTCKGVDDVVRRAASKVREVRCLYTCAVQQGARQLQKLWGNYTICRDSVVQVGCVASRSLSANLPLRRDTCGALHASPSLNPLSARCQWCRCTREEKDSTCRTRVINQNGGPRPAAERR